MSDAAEAPAKKKKGKLPIVLALVLVLGGGGFFMMKKGAKPAEAGHTVAMGEEEIPLEPEFLVNMADGRTYLRTKISVKLRKDYKKEDFAKHVGEVADAVNICLKTTDVKDTQTEPQMKRLKRRLAEAVNKALGGMPAEGAEGHGKTTEVDLSKKKDPHEKPGDIPDDWDSLEGPVLKVLFASFATQ